MATGYYGGDVLPLVAGAAISQYTIVKLSADKTVINSTGYTAWMVGVNDEVTRASGDVCGIKTQGCALVKLGGTIARGEQVTSGAGGVAVKATTVAGASVYIVGTMLESGVSGDIKPMLIQPSLLVNYGVLALADVTITTAQVLALYTTPIEIVPAPGLLKYIRVHRASACMDYNSTAYDGIAAGEDLQLRYTDGSGTILAFCETTGFLDQTSDQIRDLDQVVPIPATNLTPTANAAVVAFIATGNIATGNSPVKIRCWYTIEDTIW